MFYSRSSESDADEQNLCKESGSSDTKTDEILTSPQKDLGEQPMCIICNEEGKSGKIRPDTRSMFMLQGSVLLWCLFQSLTFKVRPSILISKSFFNFVDFVIFSLC